MTTFSICDLPIEEGNNCFELDKSLRFVHEQQFAPQEDKNERAMYHKLCHVAMKHDKPVESNAKSETQALNATFGKRFDFDFKVSLVEETIPNDSNVWNHWTGNGNSGMDGIEKTQ